jgi:cellulose synthase/poly-beta-1,6-N-acetylglucosamine synthase-like glycosyltransferase
MGLLIAFIFVIEIAVIAILTVSMWKIFEKAGKPGWAAIVPFYNILVLLEIVKKPWWWLLLMLIPYIGVIWGIWSLNLLVKSFGKDAGFTVGCLLLPFVFLPILAFGNHQYQGEHVDKNIDILDTNLV